jgi:hypothetical protein
MNSEHEDRPFLVDLEDCFVLPTQGMTKVARKDKQPRTIVEFLCLNTMVTSYQRRFVIYLRDKKKVTQLIHSLVWKVFYGEYKETYLNSVFQEDTLKDHL